MKKTIFMIFDAVIGFFGIQRIALRFSRSYVDHALNDNDGTMETNGEFDLLVRNAENRFSVLFDIGSNKGEWTVAALAAVRPKAVHCFEPVQVAFDQLSKKQFPAHVTLNKIAMGDRVGSAPMFVLDADSGGHSLYNRKPVPVEPSEMVTISTVDHYCEEKHITHIDFIKIDVEGNEMNVFEGARRMLAGGNVRFIQFEYGACWVDSRRYLRDAFRFFEGLSYDVYKIMPHGVVLMRYAERMENFQFSNYLAVRRGEQVA
jgi:FkbM family methyltransferase